MCELTVHKSECALASPRAVCFKIPKTKCSEPETAWFIWCNSVP
jgi:hypothetical protein